MVWRIAVAYTSRTAHAAPHLNWIDKWLTYRTAAARITTLHAMSKPSVRHNANITCWLLCVVVGGDRTTTLVNG